MSSDEGFDAEPSDTLPMDSLPPHPLSDDEDVAGERQEDVSGRINVDVTIQPVQQELGSRTWPTGSLPRRL